MCPPPKRQRPEAFKKGKRKNVHQNGHADKFLRFQFKLPIYGNIGKITPQRHKANKEKLYKGKLRAFCEHCGFVGKTRILLNHKGHEGHKEKNRKAFSPL